MAGRNYGYPQEMTDYGCEYDEGAYSPNQRLMAPATSSSGTSGSSVARPMQRYPQTTSAFGRSTAAPPPRGYLTNEPCLSPKSTGPTAGHMASRGRPMSPGGRSPRNAAYASSPGSSPSRIPRMQHCDDMGEAVGKGMPQTPPPVRRQVQFSCGAPSKSSSPGMSGSSMRYKRAPPKPPKNVSPLSSCEPETPMSDMFDPSMQAHLFGNRCHNADSESKQHCSLKEYDEEGDEGFLSKIMKKIKGPPTSACPLKVDFSARKKRSYGAVVKRKASCFSSKNSNNNGDQNLDQLDDLWNPETFMRWKCVDNWDQHKESLWRSVIQAKLDCPEAHNRTIEDMMCDAFKAMNAPGGECISFRMIYGILRRNEDMYLNPYISQFSDDQFLKLIIALNRFYMEDKDKRKMFFDHPPPTFIEKIMMKETLDVLDPSSPIQTMARRFWELLLDWYAKKINDAENDPDAC